MDPAYSIFPESAWSQTAPTNRSQGRALINANDWLTLDGLTWTSCDYCLVLRIQELKTNPSAWIEPGTHRRWRICWRFHKFKYRFLYWIDSLYWHGEERRNQLCPIFIEDLDDVTVCW